MKNLIVVILILLSSMFSFAQFNKGNFLVGGSGNVSGSFSTGKSKTGSITTTDGKVSSISIQPQVGYFIIDNLVVGTGFLVGLSKIKFDAAPSEFTYTSLSITPMVRYYLDHFYFQGSVGFGSDKTKSKINGTMSESKSKISSWSLMGGYAFFVNDAISFEPQIGYSFSGYKSEGSNTKSINSGIDFSIGLYGYIGRKPK